MKISINIGAMLRKHVIENRLSQSAWARHDNLNPKTVADYLKRKDMRIGTLLSISTTLNYNFFKEIVAFLPSDMPPALIDPKDKIIDDQKQKIHDLEIQLNMLKEAIRLNGGKGVN